MNYKDALKQMKRVGTAHATGDSLRAMYAKLVADIQGGPAEKYFVFLKPGTDQEIKQQAQPLLQDRQKAWNVIMGIEVA